MNQLPVVKPTGAKDCACQTCKSMCRRACWPTPEEAKALIAAGYGEKLMLDYWAGGMDPDILILCPAEKGHEGNSAPSWPGSTGCTFQTTDGLCSLHTLGLKPTEGRLASCAPLEGRNLHREVSQTWDNPEAQKLAQDWYDSR